MKTNSGNNLSKIESKALNNFYLSAKNIRDNILLFKQSFPLTKVCAIVKANAYGHGIKNVVNSIKDLVDYFGVADFFEAQKVRNLSAKPVLILAPVMDEQMEWCIKNCVSLSVSSVEYLKKIEKTAKRLHLSALVHLAVNSGMNRLGFSKKEKFEKTVEYLQGSNHLTLQGVYTHFHNSTDRVSTEIQYQKFCNIIACVKNKNIIIHASASNACLLDKKYAFDMVRLGLLMYGYCEMPVKNLKPVMKITATILNIVPVKKGEYVGYGKNYMASQNMCVACVSIGYADGYLRANSNKSRVIVNNQYANIVGNICMDLFLIDVTNISAKVGDEVIVLGEAIGKKITATEIAQNTNTLEYEILTNFKVERMKEHLIYDWIAVKITLDF